MKVREGGEEALYVPPGLLQIQRTEGAWGLVLVAGGIQVIVAAEVSGV